MVTRIAGMADRHTLEFIRAKDGYWEAQVPPDMEDGMYIVTLWAYDAAGNSAYHSTVLLMVDAHGVTTDWISDSYEVCWKKALYTAQWLSDYSAQWQPYACAVEWQADFYSVRWED